MFSKVALERQAGLRVRRLGRAARERLRQRLRPKWGKAIQNHMHGEATKTILAKGA